MAALKAGQQCLADHSPEMARVPGNPFSATLGLCTDSSGPWPAAGRGYTYPVQLSYVLLPCSDEQLLQHCLIGKEGSFSRSCGTLARRSGVCQRKEQAGTWSQVAKVWVLLLQLRKKHFAHTPKQMLREQVQETGPTLS